MPKAVEVLAVPIYVAAIVIAGCSSPSTPNKVTVFQSPDCECCGNYKAYLKKHGFQVEAEYTTDIFAIKREHQIPSDMASCHTVVFEDYFVEGHVPIEAIEKLLREKPGIDGIALPGMPPGSPGMPGQKTEAFRIYALSDGRISEFLVIGD